MEDKKSTDIIVNENGTVTALTTNNYNYDERIALMTPEEKEHYQKITASIQVSDPNSAHAFGSELSKTIARSGDTLLQQNASNGNNEIAKCMTDLLAELNMIDTHELSGDSKFKSFIKNVPILKKLVRTVENVMIKYDTISENVDKISKKIDSTKIAAYRDNSTLAQIFDSNKEYLKQSREYILAAKMKLKELDSQIDEMVAHPEQYEAFDVKKMITFRDSLEKRIADMQTSEYTLTQSLFQLETIAANNTEIAQQADNMVNNIIPLWKNQLAEAITIRNQQDAIAQHKKAREMTNKMLRLNAENIHKNAVEVAKASEESVITIETLEHTTQELVQTIQHVREIHQQGANNRKNLEQSLKKYSEQLNSAIAENA